MGKAAIVVFVLALTAALGGVVLAEPVVSGPQVGWQVPGPFHPLNVTGPDAGEKVCLYCKNGANPVAAVFAREITPGLVALVKKIDAATAAHRDDHLGSFVTFLSDAPELPATLKQLAQNEQIQSTILATFASGGPPSYKIAADADVTVILYTHHTVTANYAFRKGELTEQAADAVVADVAKILTAE
jgi:hypothetical protein